MADVQVAGSGMSWRRLLRLSAIAHVVVLVYVMAVIAMFPIPPVVITVLLLIVGVRWMRRPGRGGVIMTGVVTIISVFQAMTVGGGTKVLPHPESWLDWISYASVIVVSLVGVIAFVGALRDGSGARNPDAGRPVAVAGAIGVVAVVVVGIVLGLTFDDAAQQSGDLALTADGFDFVPETLTASAGDITLFLDNKDIAHHDFTIKDVVTAQMPGGHSRRETFRATAGTYAYSCSIHTDMKGTLTVS